MFLITQFERPRNWSIAIWRVAAQTTDGYVFVAVPYSVSRNLQVPIEVPDNTIEIHCWYGKRLIKSVTPDDLRVWDIRRRHTKKLPVSSEEYALLKERFECSRLEQSNA